MKTLIKTTIISLAISLSMPSAQAGVKSFLMKTGMVVVGGVAAAKTAKHFYDSNKSGQAGTASENKVNCQDHTPLGQPQSKKQFQILCREGFSIGYDLERKTPAWVAEHIRAERLSGSAEREAGFVSDTELPVNARSEDKDYKAQAQGMVCRENPKNIEVCMDRGHMAPAADLHWSANAMRESFFLSNVVPQNAQLNRGIWAKLEGEVRQWAKQRGELLVVTGPIYEKDMGYIGKRVQVPTYVYKIVYDQKKNESIAFVMPNQPIYACGNGSSCSLNEYKSTMGNYVASISDIERATGINFYPTLRDNSMKQHKSRMWH